MGLSSKQIKERFELKLKSSGLSKKTGTKLNMTTLTAEEAQKLGFDKAAAMKIPYFNLAGKKTEFYRIRYLETTLKGFSSLTDKKDIKYKQLAGSLNEAYLPPLINWKEYAPSSNPIIITEGELKAAACTARGWPAIGLGGVWMFRAAKKGVWWLPVLEDFNWDKRVVYVIFDSDAATNPNVLAAESAICSELTSRGAKPHIIRLPNMLESGKTGLDDYLLHAKDEEFQKMLDNDGQPYGLAEELHKMNEEVLLVQHPPIIYIHKTRKRISANDFKNINYANRSFKRIRKLKNGEEREETIQTAQEWIKWPGRSEVEELVYEPGKPEIVNGNLNTWRGWPYEPEKGNIEPWNELLDFVFAGEPESRTWFEQWCAYPLQHPGTKLFSACVIWGLSTGTGKTLIGYTLMKLYGENATEIGNAELESEDNDYAENKQFVVGEEITGGDKRGIADRLKSLVTRESVRINIKYVAKYTIRDCINYYFTSNHPDAFYLDRHDRRFFIHKVEGDPMRHDFYTRVYDPWYKSDAGMSALFHHLLTVDLEGFEPYAAPPITNAKKEMVTLGRSDLDSWVHTLREDPDAVLRIGNTVTRHELFRAEDLLIHYTARNSDYARVTPGGLARALSRGGFRKPCAYGCKTKDGQLQLWAVRNPDKFNGWSGVQLGIQYDKERELAAPKFAASTKGEMK